eukprot:CFRG8543T1
MAMTELASPNLLTVGHGLPKQRSCVELRKALRTTSLVNASTTSNNLNTNTTPLGTRSERSAFRRSISQAMFNQRDLNAANSETESFLSPVDKPITSFSSRSHITHNSRRRSLSHGRDACPMSQMLYVDTAFSNTKSIRSGSSTNVSGAGTLGSMSSSSNGSGASTNASLTIEGDIISSPVMSNRQVPLMSQMSVITETGRKGKVARRTVVDAGLRVKKKHVKQSDHRPSHRILVCGGTHVGKTTISKKFVYGVTDMQYSHMEEDTYCKNMVLDGYHLSVQVSDVSASVNAHVELTQYMKYSDAFLVVFALNDPKSITTAEECICLIRQYNGTECPMILVANKLDTVEEGDPKVRTIGFNLSQRYNLKYIETSSLRRRNTSYFYDLIRWLLYGNKGAMPPKLRRRSRSMRTTKLELTPHDTSVFNSPGQSNRSNSRSTNNLADLRKMIVNNLNSESKAGLRRSLSDGEICSKKDTDEKTTMDTTSPTVIISPKRKTKQCKTKSRSLNSTPNAFRIDTQLKNNLLEPTSVKEEKGKDTPNTITLMGQSMRRQVSNLMTPTSPRASTSSREATRSTSRVTIDDGGVSESSFTSDQSFPSTEKSNTRHTKRRNSAERVKSMIMGGKSLEEREKQTINATMGQNTNTSYPDKDPAYRIDLSKNISSASADYAYMSSCSERIPEQHSEVGRTQSACYNRLSSKTATPFSMDNQRKSTDCENGGVYSASRTMQTDRTSSNISTSDRLSPVSNQITAEYIHQIESHSITTGLGKIAGGDNTLGATNEAEKRHVTTRRRGSIEKLKDLIKSPFSPRKNNTPSCVNDNTIPAVYNGGH